jgi:hypothetical protein
VFAISLAAVFNADTAQAKSNFSQSGTVCKVTKSGGSSMYVASLDKYFRIRRGGTMIVVDPEPHQGIIVVRAMVNKKMTQGEIKLDDTNCVPILPK